MKKMYAFVITQMTNKYCFYRCLSKGQELFLTYVEIHGNRTHANVHGRTGDTFKIFP